MASTTASNQSSSNSGRNRIEFQGAVTPLLIRLSLYLRTMGRNEIQGDWDAEDGLQLVLAKAWELWQRQGFEVPRSIFHWLATIAKGVVRDRRRYLKSACRSSGTVDPQSGSKDLLALLADDKSSVATRLQRTEQVRRIMTALGNLSELPRMVVLKHAIEGLSLSQIAHDLELSKSTVWDHLQRGLRQLNERLGQDD